MSIDLSKLTRAPWVYDERVRWIGVYEGPMQNCADDIPDVVCSTAWSMNGPTFDLEKRRAEWEFIALARNAFDGDPEALAWWEANRNRRS